MDLIQSHLSRLALEGDSAETIYGRGRCLIRLAAALPGPLLEATPAQLVTWRAAFAGLAPGTIYNYCTHVREFYKWAVAEQLLDASPAEGLPVPKRPDRVPRPIREADLAAALSTATGRVRLWLVLAGWCGMRACELARLRTENINLTARIIIIAADATKGSSERKIAICDFAAAEIEQARLPLRGWAFPHSLRRGPVSPALVSKACNRYLAAHDIPATLHQLRHRFGTQAYRAGHDILAVRDLMGHKSAKTTELYTLGDQTVHRAIVARLPLPGATLTHLPQEATHHAYHSRRAS